MPESTCWPLPDGELQLITDFLPPLEAAELCAQLPRELSFGEEILTIAGRKVAAPRLVCWYGDPDAVYRYSGITHRPLPWTARLSRLRQRLESHCGRPFNSVLCNLYRDGNDSMGWHADREPELGPEPFIASLSLGATRSFELRHCHSPLRLRLELSSGSLLLMGGALQHHWRHRIPKQPDRPGVRINLTFRTIHPELGKQG